MTNEVSTLVLGIGNVIMSDDGVGVRAIERLVGSFEFPAALRLLDGGTLGLDLLPHLEGVQRLLVLDAVDAGRPPGSLIRLSGDEVPAVLETKISPHQVGLKDLLAVARLQGFAPTELVLLGVQPGSIGVGLELSAEVEAALESLVQSVLLELRRWGLDPGKAVRSGHDPGGTALARCIPAAGVPQGDPAP